MRDSLVEVGNRRDNDDALFRLALALARQHRAHVTGMQVITLDPLVLSLPEALTVLNEEERTELERRDWWLALCHKHRVNGEWCVDRGFYQSLMVRRAVFADLVLAGLDDLGSLASGVPVFWVDQYSPIPFQYCLYRNAATFQGHRKKS